MDISKPSQVEVFAAEILALRQDDYQLDQFQQQTALENIAQIIEALGSYVGQSFYASIKLLAAKSLVNFKTIRKWLPYIIRAKLLKRTVKCYRWYECGQWHRWAARYKQSKRLYDHFTDVLRQNLFYDLPFRRQRVDQFGRVSYCRARRVDNSFSALRRNELHLDDLPDLAYGDHVRPPKRLQPNGKNRAATFRECQTVANGLHRLRFSP